jgi:hypothetical protein
MSARSSKDIDYRFLPAARKRLLKTVDRYAQETFLPSVCWQLVYMPHKYSNQYVTAVPVAPAAQPTGWRAHT